MFHSPNNPIQLNKYILLHNLSLPGPHIIVPKSSLSKGYNIQMEILI